MRVFQSEAEARSGVDCWVMEKSKLCCQINEWTTGENRTRKNRAVVSIRLSRLKSVFIILYIYIYLLGGGGGGVAGATE